MALPSILRVRKRAPEAGSPSSDHASRRKEAGAPDISQADIKRSTKSRRVFIIIASLSYLLAFVFLILVSDEIALWLPSAFHLVDQLGRSSSEILATSQY